MCYPTCECKCTMYRVSSEDDLLRISDDNNLVFSDNGDVLVTGEGDAEIEGPVGVIVQDDASVTLDGSASHICVEGSGSAYSIVSTHQPTTYMTVSHNGTGWLADGHAVAHEYGLIKLLRTADGEVNDYAKGIGLQRSHLFAFDEACLKLHNNSTGDLHDASSGETRDFSHVNVQGENASAVLWGNSTALVNEGSAVGYMCSSAEVCFNSFFEGHGTSVAWLSDGARAHLYEASTAYAFGSHANVTLGDFSTLVVSPNSSVTVRAVGEHCRILVHEGATVRGVDGDDPTPGLAQWVKDPALP